MTEMKGEDAAVAAAESLQDMAMSCGMAFPDNHQNAGQTGYSLLQTNTPSASVGAVGSNRSNRERLDRSGRVSVGMGMNAVVYQDLNSVQNSVEVGASAEVVGDFEEVTHSPSRKIMQINARKTRARNRNRNNIKPELSSVVATSEKPPSGVAMKSTRAFQSVHDMIQASIIANGSRASLRDIYKYCQQNGRILYKKRGSSRLITDNEHWKSQIRHALYTSGRFVRSVENSDNWEVANSYRDSEPGITMIPVAQSELSAENKVYSNEIEEHSAALGEISNRDLTSGVKASSGPKRKRSGRRQRAAPQPKEAKSAVPEATVTTLGMGSTTTIPLEVWAQNIINSQQITHSVNMAPPNGQNAAIALQNAMNILNLLGCVGAVSIDGSNGEEEEISPVKMCENLQVEERLALASIIHQCDPKLGEQFKAAVQSEDAGTVLKINGVTKLMMRTFLTSLQRGLTISARSTHGFDYSAAAADTASSPALTTYTQNCSSILGAAVDDILSKKNSPELDRKKGKKGKTKP